MKSRHDFAGLVTTPVLALTFAIFLPKATAAPTFTVNSVVDAAASAPLDNGKCETAPDNPVCTLRAAIMKANHFPGGGVTIVIPAGTYGLTISPTGADDELTGDLNITASMTIQGAGAATTIIDANKIDRVMNVDAAATSSISGVTIRNGSAPGIGGGISNNGVLTLTNSAVTGNQSGMGSAGGGIISKKMLTLNNTVISGNVSNGNAGGLYIDGTATLSDSSVAENRTANGGYGGGIVNNGTLTMNRCLVSGNQTTPQSGNGVAGYGGGMWNANGILTVTNSTVSNNSAWGNGGGIFNDATANVFFSTFAGNLADSYAAGAGSGGGISNTGGTVNLRTTIVAQNYTGINSDDVKGTITSQDYNLIQTTAGATITGATTHNVTGANPLLDSLHDNGGTTLTRALFTGSLAIDAVPVAQCTDQVGAALTGDQRGFQRGNAPGCDIGAYEGSISSSLYGRNLVVNGDADAAAGSPVGALVAVPGWNSFATVVPYNSAGGFPNVATDMVPANHGYGFFAGANVSSAALGQAIHVSAISSQMDTGKIAYAFSADLGGYFTDGDNAKVTIFFEDGSGMPIGSGVTLGPVAPADRGNKTGFLHLTRNGAVPAGTRSFQVNVEMTKLNGTANDGYADNISVLLTPPPTLAQISTRMAVQTGDNALFGGFIVIGTQPKKVVIRGMGPSLTSLGVPGALANPTLQLNDVNGVLASNDNWVDSPDKQAIIDSGVAPGNNLESVIVATLPANTSTYTVILRGAGDSTGVGVVEVYDLDYAADSRLANISSRGLVQTGDNVMFGGFIVVGSGAQKVIVRAIGPSLSNVGVQGALSDPNLELHDANGNTIETNDNWMESANKQAIMDSGVAPSDSRESAIVKTLPPAIYTAIVSGVGNATGIATVEVYVLN